jgi:hypothetical protein
VRIEGGWDQFLNAYDWRVLLSIVMNLSFWAVVLLWPFVSFASPACLTGSSCNRRLCAHAQFDIVLPLRLAYTPEVEPVMSGRYRLPVVMVSLFEEVL